MRAKRQSAVRAVTVHAGSQSGRNGSVARCGARNGQRIRISSGLEQISGEHGISHRPGERHPLTLVLHSPVLEPDFDGRLLETELGSQFAAAWSAHVILLQELLFETGQLLTGEGSAVATDGRALLVVVVVVRLLLGSVRCGF